MHYTNPLLAYYYEHDICSQTAAWMQLPPIQRASHKNHWHYETTVRLQRWIDCQFFPPWGTKHEARLVWIRSDEFYYLVERNSRVRQLPSVSILRRTISRYWNHPRNNCDGKMCDELGKNTRSLKRLFCLTTSIRMIPRLTMIRVACKPRLGYVLKWFGFCYVFHLWPHCRSSITRRMAQQ